MVFRGQPSFIVIEGLDGTGTTTLAKLLAEALQRRDLRVCLTAEPTAGAFGRLLRRHLAGEVTLEPTTSALVFTADRQEHLDTTVRPALARGEWVVSDRYLLSTVAYQGAEGVDVEAVLAASSTFDVPDLTFVLEVPEPVRAQRMSHRDTVERYETTALADRLRESYGRATEVLRRLGHRIERIDGSPPAEDVLTTLLARIDSTDRPAT